MDMMALRRKIIDNNYLPTLMVTDNPAIFNTKTSKPLSVFVEFNPEQSGTGTPSSQNIRPFVGKTGFSLFSKGANVWDEVLDVGVINSDGSFDATATSRRTTSYIPVIPGETFYHASPASAAQGRYAYYDKNKQFVSYNGDGMDRNKAYTIPDGCYYLRISLRGAYGTTYNNDIAFNYPQINNGYVKHEGQTYEITFPAEAGTLYGGNVDVTAGKLISEWGHIASYNGESIPGEWKSDRDVYASGTTPTIGAEVVYKLTEPVEYDITPVEIMSCPGVNVMFTHLDGKIKIKYQDFAYNGKLTVMTYNVQSFNGLNADETMQKAILAEHKPLIMGLQELGIYNLPEIGDNFISSRFWNARFGKQRNKVGIASNFALSNVEYHDFVNQSSEVKGYLTAEFTYKGKTVFFVTTHLVASDSASLNAAQALELFNLVQTKDTFILVGDMNTDVHSTADTQYINVIKQFVDAGYNLANCSPVNGFIGTWTSAKTASAAWEPEDNIITSADFTMSNVHRDTLKIAQAEIQDKGIDHVALICDLTL